MTFTLPLVKGNCSRMVCLEYSETVIMPFTLFNSGGKINERHCTYFRSNHSGYYRSEISCSVITWFFFATGPIFVGDHSNSSPFILKGITPCIQSWRSVSDWSDPGGFTYRKECPCCSN